MDAILTFPSATHTGADSMSLTASHASEKILSVEALTVSFDGFRAVDSLSLSVDRNELRVIHRGSSSCRSAQHEASC